MAISVKLISVFLLIFFASQAFGACGPSRIIVNQSKTGAVVEGQPEYQVTVSNKCRCPQSEVIVKCFGLSSVETVNPGAIRRLDGERCIVNKGRAIPQGSPIKFKYAWLTPQDFPVISTKSSC